jgi:hypothetical protein
MAHFRDCRFYSSLLFGIMVFDLVGFRIVPDVH